MNQKIVGINVLDIRILIILIKVAAIRIKGESSGDKNTVNFSKEDARDQLFSCMDVGHQSKNTWYLDSGCSHHITGDRKAFI